MVRRRGEDDPLEDATAFLLGGDADAPDGADEAALVRAARSDAAAFGDLYRWYLPRIYRYARSRTDGEEDAADLAQQVFLKALSGLAGYRGDVPLAAWLFRIARNSAADEHRRRRHTSSWTLLPESLHPAADGNPEAEALRQEGLARLAALLATLDEERRELIRLRFAAGLTAREIGAVVGKSEAAVYKQLSRTLRLLEEELGDR